MSFLDGVASPYRYATRFAARLNTENLSSPESSKSPQAASSSSSRQHGDWSYDGCKCKTNRCQKMYCECFARDRYCSDKCKCTGCRNCKVNEPTLAMLRKSILDRNPGAFARSKKRRRTDVSACKCSKSGCVKKYCECFRKGMQCSIFCECIGCMNGKEEVDESELFGNVDEFMFSAARC